MWKQEISNSVPHVCQSHTDEDFYNSSVLTLELLGWQITALETFTFLLVAQGISMWTHTHNRDIMKHRDRETSDETLQLILGLLPMDSPRPPLCLSQLLGFLSLRRSRRSYCPPPHAANLSPLTQDFTLFKPSSTVPPTLIRRSRTLLLLAPSRCYSTDQSVRPRRVRIHRQRYDNRADDTEITLMPLSEALLSCLKAPRPAAGSWTHRQSAVTWTWHLRPCRDVLVLRFASA